MPIKIKTPNSQITASFNGQYEERVTSVIIRTLQYVGEKCITEAREGGTYQDQTGNLRSSIGYAIVKDGVVVNSTMSQKIAGTKTSEDNGNQIGSDYLKKISKEYQGISLIVVAGMRYAAYVESRGYNVLTSSEILADQLVPQLLKQLGFETK